MTTPTFTDTCMSVAPFAAMRRTSCKKVFDIWTERSELRNVCGDVCYVGDQDQTVLH
jgi:hypothetical protein